ncbi:MAG: GNAT family N-acetyltransferase [Novosphingobium sp.]
MNIVSDEFSLDQFKITARDVADASLESLIALSVGVGWFHRLEDWAFMREIGRGQVAMDETGRVHGVAMWFPFADHYATIGMVITSPKLQKNGGGQWLMRHVLKQTQGRALGLHATRQSHKLFLSLGFSDEGTVYQFQGNVGLPPDLVPASGTEVRKFGHTDLPAIVELDRMATGWDRRELIDALVARSRGMVLSRMGKVEAFALMRPFGRGMVVGPIIAPSEEDALRILQPLIADSKNSFVRIDVRDETGQLANFAKVSGLQLSETVTRMSLGNPWPFSAGSSPAQWALASHATG